MSNTMRWRYGDTNPIVAPVQSPDVIEIGDLLVVESNFAKPASSLPDLGLETANQDELRNTFLSVAMQSPPSGEVESIRVATTGVSEYDCLSSTFNLGDFIGADEDSGGTFLLSQIVAKVALVTECIGRCVRQESTATTKCSSKLLAPSHAAEHNLHDHDGTPACKQAGVLSHNKPELISGNETLLTIPKEIKPVTLNYRELKRRYELDGADRTVQHLSESLRKGHLKSDDFSIRDLAETLVPEGRHWVRMLDPRNSGSVSVLEASEGVDVTAFLNITGQVIYSKILDAYTQEAFVASKLVQTVPTRMDGEKIPGATRVANELDEVAPGMPYPHLGFGEDYIETPSTSKRGFIVPVTKEAIFFDRTHLVLNRAAEVGEVLGLNKEKRLLDLLIGVTNNYKSNGTTFNTYYTASPWKNELATNELVDWTNVDTAEQLFAEMTDPATGEPVLVRGTNVLVMPAYRHAAHRVFNAAEINYAESGSSTTTIAANPLGNYRVEESRLAYRRIVASGVPADDAKKWWFVGDFHKAFAYMENWPITVTQAPICSEADFTNDIVLRFKASERGAAAVLNPRYVVKCTG